MRTLVRELKEKIGQTVTLYLTLETLRDQKHLQFILGKDKSGIIQLVISKDKVTNHEDISTLLQGSAFIVTGKAIESTQSKTFGIEIQVDSLEIISKAEVWPITQESAIDLRFDYRYVDLHFPKQQLMLKIRNAFLQGCRQFLLKEEFCEFTTPSLIGRASESGSECFSVPYFDKTAYLRQSPQMAKQLLCVTGLDYFEVGSIFRMEGGSSRHLTEFTGLDVEKSWVFSTKEIMEFEEAMLKAGFAALEPFKEEVLKVYGIELLTEPSVVYMTLDEAKAILKEHAGIHSTKDSDLSDEGERLLHEIVKKDFIFVSDYPIAKRPFYHMWEEEKGTTKSFDLIFRGIEITSGAVREYRYDKFVEQVQKKGVSLESVKEYSEIFKISKPHAGFGIGVERVISRILGISVKEAAILVRDHERLLP